jgi:hypothetical protein
MEGVFVSKETLGQIFDATRTQPERVPRILSEMMSKCRPESDWVAKVEADKDLDRLCVLAAALIANSMRSLQAEESPRGMYLRDIAESASLALDELKARLK